MQLIVFIIFEPPSTCKVQNTMDATNIVVPCPQAGRHSIPSTATMLTLISILSALVFAPLFASPAEKCRCLPGDPCWPSPEAW